MYGFTDERELTTLQYSTQGHPSVVFLVDHFMF